MIGLGKTEIVEVETLPAHGMVYQTGAANAGLKSATIAGTDDGLALVV